MQTNESENGTKVLPPSATGVPKSGREINAARRQRKLDRTLSALYDYVVKRAVRHGFRCRLAACISRPRSDAIFPFGGTIYNAISVPIVCRFLTLLLHLEVQLYMSFLSQISERGAVR